MKKSCWDSAVSYTHLDVYKRQDKNCAPYLKHDTGQAFGVAENCYLCIDSGKPGIENAVKIIEASYHTLS